MTSHDGFDVVIQYKGLALELKGRDKHPAQVCTYRLRSEHGGTSRYWEYEAGRLHDGAPFRMFCRISGLGHHLAQGTDTVRARFERNVSDEVEPWMMDLARDFAFEVLGIGEHL